MCDKTKSPWASESISDTSDPKNLLSNDAPGLSNHPGRPPKEPNKIAARKDNRDRLLNQPSNALSTGVNSANDTDDGVVTSRPSSAESNASEYYIETGRDCLLRSDSDLVGPDEDQSEKTSAGGYHEEQPACKIRIDSAQVPEQSEDEQDLKEEDEKEQVAALKQRNLYMAIQGLRQKRVTKNRDASPEDNTEEEPASKIQDTEAELNVLHYRRRFFQKGRCYDYCDRSNKAGTVIVGIVGFLPISNEARCVLICPVSETFLGIEDDGTH